MLGTLYYIAPKQAEGQGGHDPRTDIQEYYCSPVEQESYNRLFGSGASSKGAP